MHVSFSSLVVVNDPFEWAYELEDRGFSGWEIVGEGRQTIDESTLPAIRNILETTHLTLTVHLPFSDLNLASLNHRIWEESIRQMEQCIWSAGDFVRLAVVHPGHLSPVGMQLPDLAFDQQVLGLRRLADFAGDYGITIGLENMVNMPHIFGKHAHELSRIVSAVDRDNIGMVLDIGHAHTNHATGEFLDIIDKVVHVHAHDNDGSKDEHLPIGRGTVDWKPVMEKLRNFRGRVVTEARTVAEGVESLSYIRNF